MGFPFSGNGSPLSFSELQTEFGGSNPISMSEYYRNGAYVTDNNVNVPTSGVIAFSNFYGASKKFTVTISTTATNVSAATILTAAGWNTESFFQITINAGVTAYATSTSNGGLTVSGSYPYGFAIINNGVLMGMGGAGGSNVAPYAGGNGGPALSITNSYTTAQMSVTNNSGAYIAGGGGGGAGMPNSGGEITGGGGGGAGGGAGGVARQNRGGYNLGVAGLGGGLGSSGTAGTGDPAGAGSGGGGAGGGGGSYVLDGISATRDGGGCGAGGGRILPGTGGAGGTSGDNGGNGGSAGAAGGNGTFSGSDHVGAGGGGGWGAAGGSATHSTNSASGGAGGAAIDKNGSTVTVTNSGTIYGSIVA